MTQKNKINSQKNYLHYCENRFQKRKLQRKPEQGVYMFVYRILFSGSPSYSCIYLIPFSRYRSVKIVTFILVSSRSIFRMRQIKLSVKLQIIFTTTCTLYDGLWHFVIPLTLDKTILNFKERQVNKERNLNFQ